MGIDGGDNQDDLIRDMATVIIVRVTQGKITRYQHSDALGLWQLAHMLRSVP